MVLFTFLVFDSIVCPAASAKSVSKSFTDNGEIITFLSLLSLKIAWIILEIKINNHLIISFSPLIISSQIDLVCLRVERTHRDERKAFALRIFHRTKDRNLGLMGHLHSALQPTRHQSNLLIKYFALFAIIFKSFKLCSENCSLNHDIMRQCHLEYLV